MIKPVDDTIVYLEQLGLTQYEAKVYLALLSEHPATAYTISRRSGVPHSPGIRGGTPPDGQGVRRMSEYES